MVRKINLIKYEVDEAMMGSEWDSEKYSLEDFCEVLQLICTEKCLFFEIVPITDSYNGATHDFEDIEYTMWSSEHLGRLPQYQYKWDLIPFDEAIDKYFKK